MASKIPDRRMSETTARLLLTNDSTEAWLSPISSKDDVDLYIDAKGDGNVYIGGSPALTAESLGNIDELATVLAGITIEGADPAAVAAIAADLQSIVNALANAKPGVNASLAEGVAGVATINGDLVSLDARLTDLAGQLAGIGPTLFNMIMLSCGIDLSSQGPFVATAVNSINTWTGIDLSSPEALIASLDLTTLGTGTGGVDEAAVNALIEAQLTGIGPILQQAIQSQIGHLDDKLDLNSTKPQDGSFVISTNNLTGAQWKTGVDFQTQRGGEVTVNGKRVLTEDDALGTGGAVDTAAVIQAVVDYLEVAGIGAEDPRLPAIINILAQQEGASLEQASDFYNSLHLKQGMTEQRVDDLIDWADEQFNDLRAQVAALTGLTPEQETSLANAIDLAQGVVNILGGKPQGGGTLEDVAAVFGNLGATFQAQLDDAVSAITTEFQGLLDAIGGKPDSTVEEVQAFFANMQQAVGEAIASIWKAAPDKLTLNVRSANASDKVTIESHQLTPHPPNEARAVDVDIAPYGDGRLTVNGKRVLTEEDALNASGIDQAAIDAAIANATADLAAENAALKQDIADLRAFMMEQNQNLTDLMYGETSQLGQLALAEKDKLQKVMDILGGRTNATVVHVEQSWQSLMEYVQEQGNQFQQTMAEIVDYVISEYATKGELENSVNNLAGVITAVMQAIAGPNANPVEVAAFFTQLKADLAAISDNIVGYVDESLTEKLDEKLPELLEALSAHLENVLAIFTQGGQPGQIVTPAQLTQLLADIARDYATKDQLTTALQPYAKKDDADQELTARVLTTRGVIFSTNNEVLAPVDYEDYGTRLSIVPKNATSVDDAGIVVTHIDLQDLVPGTGK